MANPPGTNQTPQKTSNGPTGIRSIKTISRGMGIGISMLPNQPVQTTAIPQTPAVCTAAVKWKNKIQPPDNGDKAPIIEKDENSQQQQQPVDNNSKDSKQWPDVVTKTPGTKQTSTPIKVRRKIKKIPKAKVPNTSVSKPDDATGTDDTQSDSPRKTPTLERNSTSPARASLVSADVEKSPVHEPQQTRQLIQNEDKEEEGDKKAEVQRADNQLIAAIPVMPLSLAIMCLFLNIVAPGTGTIISSFSLLCCNKRPEPASGKKEDAVDLMITNLCVGISQLFTVTFLFIGFIWSVSWGVFMVQFAWVRYKKDKEERARQAAISVANAFLRPGFR